MGRPAKWRGLLADPEVHRWYDQLALGSIATAEERLRVLGRYCEQVGTTPQKLVRLAHSENRGRRAVEDQLMDFVARMIAEGKAPGYCENFVKSVKSWLLFNEVTLVRKIRVGDRHATPTLDHERVPTKEELHGAIAVAPERGKVIISLCAFSGLRPETLANRKGTDGLRLKDLPELEIKDGRVRVRRVPIRIIVRRTLSKTKRHYFTFAPAQGCRYIFSYLERRIAGGEVLEPDSPVVRVEIRRERQGRPRDAPHHGSPFLTTSQITKEIRRYLWTQIRLRPYVLRSYFDTNLELAERHGKITDSDRKFFMGRAGDIDRRYTTGKAQLPADVMEEMRKSFQESSGFLVTEEAKASDHYSPLGYPTLPAWAMPEEYGAAVQELLQLREKQALALEEFKREFQRVQELRRELERSRQLR